MKSKKAQTGDLIIWLYRFFLIIIIVLAYIFLLGNFLYMKYDVRSAEAALLERKAANCLATSGFIVNENFDNEKLKECTGLSSMDSNEINDYYISAILNYAGKSQTIDAGNKDLRELCGLEGNVPACSSDNFYALVVKNNKIEGAKLTISSAILKVDEKYRNI